MIADHDRKAQSFEDTKNTKVEYLYEQMVNFQEYIDTAKETLETIVKETEEMDDFVFLRVSNVDRMFHRFGQLRNIEYTGMTQNPLGFFSRPSPPPPVDT